MYFVNLSSSQSFWFTSHSVESVAGSCWDVSRPRVKGWMMTPRYVVKVWSQGMMPTWNQGLWGFVGPSDYVLGSGLFRGPCDIMWLCSSIRLNLSKCCSRKSSSWSNLTQALVPSQSPVICELSPSIRSSLPWCVVLGAHLLLMTGTGRMAGGESKRPRPSVAFRPGDPWCWWLCYSFAGFSLWGSPWHLWSRWGVYRDHWDHWDHGDHDHVNDHIGRTKRSHWHCETYEVQQKVPSYPSSSLLAENLPMKRHPLHGPQSRSLRRKWWPPAATWRQWNRQVISPMAQKNACREENLEAGEMHSHFFTPCTSVKSEASETDFVKSSNFWRELFGHVPIKKEHRMQGDPWGSPRGSLRGSCLQMVLVWPATAEPRICI